MKHSFLITLLISGLLCLDAVAHPPIAIVADSKGNIYYSDLERIWKIEPSGKKTVVVPGVHTHELYMDKNDNLYGQHSLYSGEATNRYSHYVWRLDRQNKLERIIPLTDGFYIDNFSFVRDNSGNMYWIKHYSKTRMSMMKTSARGVTTRFADGDFEQVQWMHVMSNRLYYVKHDNIYSVDGSGRVRRVSDKLNPRGRLHHSVFGLWSDPAGNLYLANASRKMVQMMNSKGELCTVYTSPGKWMPTGGTFDKAGNLWVLECNDRNEIRASKITGKRS